MALLTARCGKTDFTVSQRVKPSVDLPQVYEAPGGLHPVRLATYTVDEYRMLYGWPVPVPDHDIRGEGLVSGSGQVVSFRPDPDEVRTNAVTRWIAEPEYFTDNSWYPLQSEADLIWRSSPDFLPDLVDYQYRVGSERFYATALNFDSDARSHMWMDSSTSLSLSSYTVIMVMSPNSVTGNNLDVPYNGIWSSGDPTPDGQTVFEETRSRFNDVTLQGYWLYYESNQAARRRTISVANQLDGNAPVYLVLSFSRPRSHITVARGPDSIRKVSIPSGSLQDALDPVLLLGRSHGDVLHTADMALLDLSLYTNVLNDDEVVTEIATLAQTYGGGM